jgi:hypothetical protein
MKKKKKKLFCQKEEGNIKIFYLFRIDNHLNIPSSQLPLINRGFSLRFLTENFFRLKITKVKEKDYWNFKLDVLIINTVDHNLEIKSDVVNFMKEIQKTANEDKLKNEIIYKEQISTEFMDYFLVYRMKLLVIVLADDKKVK